LPEGALQKIDIDLCPSDFDRLNKYRGDLSNSAFISLLLRMIDSGAVSSSPDWAPSDMPPADGVPPFE
jgi:hypothetical protein